MDDDSLTNHPVIRRANSASSSKIQLCVPRKQTVKNKEYSFHICKSSELSEPVKERIWSIFEKNMKLIYESSDVFPWDPPVKRQQIFNELSRFLLIGSDSGLDNVNSLNGEDVIAYSVFRFERYEERNVIYVYELQISETARRLGLGKALIHNMEVIGKKYTMSAMMLTHLKINNAAKTFYDSLGFEIDETSPDFEDEQDDEDIEKRKSLDVDEGYSILSRRIDTS